MKLKKTAFEIAPQGALVLTVDTNGRIEWLNWTGEVTHG